MKIKELQALGHKVCFVGDGINDALALRQADVSVSVCGATNLATDCAQVVLMTPSLLSIERVLEIALGLKRTLRTSIGLCYGSGFSIIGGVLIFGLGYGPAMVIYSAFLAACVASSTTPRISGPRQSSGFHGPMIKIMSNEIKKVVPMRKKQITAPMKNLLPLKGDNTEILCRDAHKNFFTNKIQYQNKN